MKKEVEKVLWDSCNDFCRCPMCGSYKVKNRPIITGDISLWEHFCASCGNSTIGESDVWRTKTE